MTTTHRFEPAVPVHTYQRIVEQIEQAILSGEIPVGSQLASERDLMVQFGVSRPTVRESLRVLQSMGLLESKPGTRGGPIVRAPSSSALRRSFRAMIGTDALGIAELIEYRVVLEGTASRLAALRRSPEQLERMRAALEIMAAEAASNAATFSDSDLEFHEAVWEASGNRVLQLSGQAVSGVLRQLMQRESAGEHRDNRVKLDSVRIDRGLFEAISRGDAAEASRIARNAVAERFAPLVDDEDARRAILLLAE
ncbi:FadR/GntR family transcriptional regulator [Leucobacter luti]|uniref:FadR/GntR family transcriptional regulator n=1 Tax=Leucobacter luti TaxID=340320 RepID=UPI003D01214B